MDFIIIIIICFFVIIIPIGIIRWTFSIGYIVSLLEKSSRNTFNQFELLKIIKKQNDHSIGQSKVFIEQQERMLEILEQGIELFENNRENQN